MVGAAEITPVSSFTMSSYGVNLSPMAVNFATAGVGGMIVVQQTKTSPLQHYNTLGYVIVAIMIINIFMVYRVSNIIKSKQHLTKV